MDAIIKESLQKELGIKMTTQPMHKGAMAALFLKKAKSPKQNKTNRKRQKVQKCRFMNDIQRRNSSKFVFILAKLYSSPCNLTSFL